MEEWCYFLFMRKYVYTSILFVMKLREKKLDLIVNELILIMDLG